MRSACAPVRCFPVQLRHLASRPHDNVIHLVSNPFFVGPRLCLPLELCDADLLVTKQRFLAAGNTA